MLQAGLYEQVVNHEVQEKIATLPAVLKKVEQIDKEEASLILSQYLSSIIRDGLEKIKDSGGKLEKQVELVNQIVEQIKETTGEEDFSKNLVGKKAEQLLALLSQNDPRLALNHTAAKEIRPETSLAQSSLFTGAVNEPQMVSELKKEIQSSDEIDMLVSFIKWSGLRLIFEELKEFTQNGGRLRIVTTSYTGATDPNAIEKISQLPNTEVKISYDTKHTRLHAKTYVFRRNSGFSTAYVGSSNLSKYALVDGLEWNVKLTAKDQPDTLKKIDATFDSYWYSSEFVSYTEKEKERFEQAIKAERGYAPAQEERFAFDLWPYTYQREILDRLNAQREVHRRYKNLIVAATGTGKTMISAFDYKRFAEKKRGQKNRLLFVAHREEILTQSLKTFRAVLKDPNFGERMVGRHRPQSTDHLFVSIQSLNAKSLHERLAEDYYDYIVIDEFHHAAAPSYQELLTHFKPQILLGLTATPERMDGKTILDYFDGHIAAEIRLPHRA